jgi:hypothetical protein
MTVAWDGILAKVRKPRRQGGGKGTNRIDRFWRTRFGTNKDPLVMVDGEMEQAFRDNGF